MVSSTDVEANALCQPLKQCGRYGLVKKFALVIVTLTFVLASLSSQNMIGVELDEDTCEAPGTQGMDAKMWKAFREFRRLVQGTKKLKKQFAWMDHTGNVIDMGDTKFEDVVHDDVAKRKRNVVNDDVAKRNVAGEDGTLTVTVVEAKNLHDHDYWGKTDPYVECNIVGQTDNRLKTPALYNTLTPKWNTEVEWAHKSGDNLKCIVYDEDYGYDDHVGTIIVPAAKLVKDGGLDETFTLTETTNSGATLRIKAKFEKKTTPAPTPAPTGPKGPFWWACNGRARKDWNDLTADERKLYLEGINKIKTTPRQGETSAGPGKNIYDTFVSIHEQNTNKAYAHQTAGFLAWHRKYLIEFEEAIRGSDDKFKCVTVPYWDWSSETFACKAGGSGCDTYHGASQLLKDFGGPGNAAKTTNTHGSSGSGAVGCVTTGPFANWVDGNGKCLSRGVNWKVASQKPFTGRVRMLEVLKYKEYGSQLDTRLGFRLVLEGIPHGSTHNYLGGHMRSFASPADPIFFSHHCYVDKLWAVWQDCHDYDTLAIKNKLLADPDNKDNHKYYEETRSAHYNGDGPDDKMPFLFSATQKALASTSQCAASGSKCLKTNTKCAACVHGRDGWCARANWDGSCCAQCASTLCAKSCGAEQPPADDMHVKGSTHLKGWLGSESTPAHMYSVHHMAHGRSYSYAADEIEKHLKMFVPLVFGTCNLDSHKEAQKGQEGVLAETTRLHHKGTRYGKSAYAYSMMISQAFNQTAVQQGKQSSFAANAHDEDLYEHSMELAEKMECSEMAGGGGCAGYRKKYNCAIDEPRFLLPWMGPALWSAVMSSPKLKQKVMQDACCKGDLEALEPGQVPCLSGNAEASWWAGEAEGADDR